MVSATIPLVSSKLEVAVLGARGERYVLRTWVPGFLGSWVPGFLGLWGRWLILDAVHRPTVVGHLWRQVSLQG